LANAVKALTQFLDVPWCKGDEYHVQKLATLCAAPGPNLAYSQVVIIVARTTPTASHPHAKEINRIIRAQRTTAALGTPVLRRARLRRAVLLERVLNVRAGGPDLPGLIAGLFALPTFATTRPPSSLKREKLGPRSPPLCSVRRRH